MLDWIRLINFEHVAGFIKNICNIVILSQAIALSRLINYPHRIQRTLVN